MHSSQFSTKNGNCHKMRIVAMTVCCVDVYPQNDVIYVGGNSVNFAVRCIKTGISDVSVLGAIGADDYGRAVINCLVTNRIDISRLYIRQGKTATNKIYISDCGDRFFLPDSWDGGVYQSFRLSEEDWKFAAQQDIVAIPANNPNFATAIQRLGGGGQLVVDFLDMRDQVLLETAFPKIALGFISADREMVARLIPLSQKITAPIIVTLGAEGSIGLLEGNQFYQEAVLVDNIVDTTGCGDNYQAAFTVSWFKNHDLQLAMKDGALAAADTLRHFGGV